MDIIPKLGLRNDLLGIVMIGYVYVYNVRMGSKLGMLDWITIYVYIVFVIMVDVAFFIAHVVICVHCLLSVYSSGMSIMNDFVQNNVHGCMAIKHVLDL